MENIVGVKKEKMLVKRIFSFFTPTMFSKFFFPMDYYKLEFLCQSFPKQTLVFTRLQYKSFENTVGKRRNCSWRAISPFPHGVSYPFGELSAIIIKFEIIIYKLF